MRDAPRQTGAKHEALRGAALPGLHCLPGRHVKKGVLDCDAIELLGIGSEILRRRHVVRIQDSHPVAMRPATGAKVQRLGLT